MDVIRIPDIVGVRGAHAWEVVVPTRPEYPAWSGTVAAWVVQQPGIHACWEYWFLSVVHLRPIEGFDKPTHFQFDGATHEFQIQSMNPEHCPPNPDKPEEFRFLSPPDLIHQCGGIDDDEANEMARIMVSLCMRGQTSLDSDNREFWKRAITNGAEHAALGGHPTAKA